MPAVVCSTACVPHPALTQTTHLNLSLSTASKWCSFHLHHSTVIVKPGKELSPEWSSARFMLLQSADSAFWLFITLRKTPQRNWGEQHRRGVQRREAVLLKRNQKNYLASLSLVITESELTLKKKSDKNSFWDHNAILNSFPSSINYDL